MAALDNIKRIVVDKKDYLINRSILGESFRGLLVYLNLIDQTINAKQTALGFTPENVANKATDLTSPDNTKYPTTLAVNTAIASSLSPFLLMGG